MDEDALLEFPLAIVQRADVTRLEPGLHEHKASGSKQGYAPARDAVEVEGMLKYNDELHINIYGEMTHIADTPSRITLLRGSRDLVSLTINAYRWFIKRKCPD